MVRVFLARHPALTRFVGAEPLFYSLIDTLEWDLAMGTSSLHCLKLDPSLRRSVGEALVPTSKIKVCLSISAAYPADSTQDVLYVILVAQGRVITLVRPKKHSIHPSGLSICALHVGVTLLTSSSSLVLPVSTWPRIQQIGLRRLSLLRAASAASCACFRRSAASALRLAVIRCVLVMPSDPDSDSSE